MLRTSILPPRFLPLLVTRTVQRILRSAQPNEYLYGSLPRRKSYSEKPFCDRVANAEGVQDHARRRPVERLVASGHVERERPLARIHQRGQRRDRPVAVPESRQVQHAGLKTARQHGAVGADQAIRPVALAGAPLRLPESQQGLEVLRERLGRRNGYSILAGRIDLLQQAPDFLPGIGAQRIQIAVPVLR